MRMQVAFRETTANHKGHNVTIIVGIWERDRADEKEYEQAQLPLNFEFVENKLKAITQIYPPSHINHPDETLNMITLESLVTTEMRRASPQDGVNADICMRLTALKPRGRTYAFVGLLFTEPNKKINFSQVMQFEASDETTRMEFKGILGKDIRPEIGGIDMTTLMKGEALGQYLKHPVWGFNPEPYSLPGTMPLEYYRCCQSLRTLESKLIKTEREKEQEHYYRWKLRLEYGQHDPQDNRFTEFKKKIANKCSINVYSPMSASEVRIYDEACDEIIKEIKEKESSYNFTFGT